MRDRLRNGLGKLVLLFRRPPVEAPYKSPQEMALENAADSLGVRLGEYYPQDFDIADVGVTEDGDRDDPRAAAAREELLAYMTALGARQARQRRARQTRALAGVAAVTAAASGVWAAGTVSEGGEGGAGTRHSPPRQHLKGPALVFANTPAPLGSSVSSTLRIGRTRYVNSTYLNRAGDMCSALIEVRAGISERNNVNGCRPPAQLSTDLRREPAITDAIVVLAGWTVIQGYARPDVERIAGRSPWGSVNVAISRSWTPEGDDTVRPLPVRAFLVVARHGGGGRRRLPEPLAERALDDRTYNLAAELQDGRVVPVRSFRAPGPHGRDRLVDPIATALAD